MEEIINKYKDHLLINGCSYNTIYNYIAKLKEFLKIIDNKITQETIDRFFIQIKDKYNARSLNFYRATLTSFFKFSGQEFKLPKHYKEIRKEIQFIKEEELKKDFIPAIEAEFTNALQVKALLYFMFYTGLRKKDICKLKRADFDLPNQKVKVYISKSKLEKYVCYPPIVKHLVESYFISEPEEDNAFNIKYRYFLNIFERLKPYFKNKNIYPHLFRHSFASHSIKSGMNMTSVQKLLGHANIKTTEIYTHTSFEDIEKEYHEKIG